MPLAALMLLLAAAPDSFPLPAAPGPVLRMSCRQGECMWQQFRKIERVRAGKTEVLRKITSRIGRSTYSVYGSPPPWSRKLRLAWERAPRVEYVRCSKRRPATAFWDADDREWVVTRLHLSNLGGYEYAAANLYMQVCHALGPDRWSERRIPRMGYREAAGGQDRYKTLAEMLRAMG
jgi:hypothetical protein